MFIIVGLGNPSKEYANTRHNIGFDVIDTLAENYHIPVNDRKHKALIGKGVIEGNKVILAKPQTYMNLSGDSVRALTEYYKVDETSELIIVHDDISLDVGQIRIRKKGSAGGHNGLKSIIQQLGHDEFMRIKMGVGDKPKGYDLADYVLGHFNQEERAMMEEATQHAIASIKLILAGETDTAMNLYNTKVKPQSI